MITITIKGDEVRANEIMEEIAESIGKEFLPVNVYPGNKFQIHECPEEVRNIVKEISTPLAATGTPPDTSLHLGRDRRAWLQSNGGIQPTICKLIDAAMTDSPALPPNLST